MCKYEKTTDTKEEVKEEMINYIKQNLSVCSIELLTAIVFVIDSDKNLEE